MYYLFPLKLLFCVQIDPSPPYLLPCEVLLGSKMEDIAHKGCIYFHVKCRSDKHTKTDTYKNY